MDILLSNYSFILITIAVLLRIVNKYKRFTFFAYACSLGIAVGQGFIEPIGFAYIMSTIVVMVIYFNKKNHQLIKLGAFLFLLIFGYNLILHKLPGFNNVQLIFEKLGEHSEYYRLWLNFDSTFFLGFLFLISYQPISFKRYIVCFFKGGVIGLFLAGFLAVLCVRYNIIRVDYSVPDIIWMWLWVMSIYALFSECFYRMFIIDFAENFFSGSRLAALCAVLVSSCMFGYSHMWGGVMFMYASIVAGCVYSFSYLYSGKRIEASAFSHIVVNVIHFVFFTYPFLMQSK